MIGIGPKPETPNPKPLWPVVPEVWGFRLWGFWMREWVSSQFSHDRADCCIAIHVSHTTGLGLRV